MVIDELIVRKGTTNMPIDSYDNQMIDEIVYEGNTYHFAKQKDLLGETSVNADNAVQEPLISLKVSGNTKQSLLPLEYQQVEYIESTGTQYIDTGVKGGSNIKMQFEGAFKRITGFSGVTGSRNAYLTSANASSFCFFANTGNEDYQYYLTSYKTTDMSANKMSVEMSKDGIFFNGVLKHQVAQETWSNDYNITIFAINTAGTIGYGKNHKIYSYKLYESSVLIRNFIPCYRKSDNVIGLYDLVNNVFYTNQGTGTFLKGANAPTPEIPIPILNAGDNGIECVLSGVNLFNTPNDINFAFGVYGQLKNNDLIVSGNATKAYSSTLVAHKLNLKAKQYTFRIKGKLEGATRLRALLYSGSAFVKNIGTITSNGYIQSISNFTLTDTHISNEISIQFIIDLPIDITTDVNLKLDILEGLYTSDTIPQYQPYFEPKTLSLPSSVTVDGQDVDLRFAKYKNADYLLIEKGKVKYFAYSTEGDPTKPLSEQVENVPPIEYDLTDTEIGQNLLALATEKGTNILEIKSEIPVSQTELSYWRQIIPNE